ncbi:MAG: gluconokinase [Actinobacteria bacterium]|nr:gluconokinase [Actinomycetota bacterium]
MGVSGSGKSTIGKLLSEQLGYAFIDADDLHPESNKRLMASGIPLTDVERSPWLDNIGSKLAEYSSSNTPLIVACSALKHSYRDKLRRYSPTVNFLFLDGTRSQIQSQISTRDHEFMPSSLLDSQFADLEVLQADERGLRIELGGSPLTTCTAIIKALALKNRN